MKSYVVLIVLVVAVFCRVAHSYPGGAPPEACGHMFPVGHHVDAQDSFPPYQIEVSPKTYSPGGNITVTLNVLDPSNYYEGVFIQARKAHCDHMDDKPVGTFYLSTTDARTHLQTRDCFDNMNNGVTHQSTFKKKHLVFTWTAPWDFRETIYFRGTFVRETKEFWTNVFSEFVTGQASGGDTPMTCPVIQYQHQLTAAALGLNASHLFVAIFASIVWISYRY